MVKKLRVRVKGRWYMVEVGDLQSSPVVALVDGDPVEVHIQQSMDEGQLDGSTETAPRQTSELEGAGSSPASAVRVFNTPMPGVIMSVAVQVGDQLVTGDEICVLEAMKMQQTLRADWTGIVKAVHVQPGQQVLDGDPILDFE